MSQEPPAQRWAPHDHTATPWNREGCADAHLRRATCPTKTQGETGHYTAEERPRPTSTPPPWPPRGNTRERIPSESRTSSGEVGSSRHKLSNSSRELSSPPKPKGAGRLPEKTLGKAGGKPSGELDKPDARERETIGNQGARNQSAQCPKWDKIRGRHPREKTKPSAARRKSSTSSDEPST